MLFALVLFDFLKVPLFDKRPTRGRRKGRRNLSRRCRNRIRRHARTPCGRVRLLNVGSFRKRLGIAQRIGNEPTKHTSCLTTCLQRHTSRGGGALLLRTNSVVKTDPPMSTLLQSRPAVRFLGGVKFSVKAVNGRRFSQKSSRLLHLLDNDDPSTTGICSNSRFP